MRKVSLVFIVGNTLLHACLSASQAAPKLKTSFDPVSPEGLSLSVHSPAKCTIVNGSITTSDIGLWFVNNRDSVRSISEMPACINRVELCPAIQYIIRFPDGRGFTIQHDPRIFHLRDWHAGIEASKLGSLKPLTLPGEGRLYGRLSASIFIDDHKHREELRKTIFWNKGQFALTLIVETLGLQSNTLLFGDCPAPPPTYSPLKSAKSFREAEQARKERVTREHAEIVAEHEWLDEMYAKGFLSKEEYARQRLELFEKVKAKKE